MYDYDSYQVQPSSNKTNYNISTYSDTSINKEFHLATRKKSHSLSKFTLLIFSSLSIFIQKYLTPGEYTQALSDTTTPILLNIIIEFNDDPQGFIQQNNS